MTHSIGVNAPSSHFACCIVTSYGHQRGGGSEAPAGVLIDWHASLALVSSLLIASSFPVTFTRWLQDDLESLLYVSLHVFDHGRNRVEPLNHQAHKP